MTFRDPYLGVIDRQANALNEFLPARALAEVVLDYRQVISQILRQFPR
jgi:hypothetical protein